MFQTGGLNHHLIICLDFVALEIMMASSDMSHQCLKFVKVLQKTILRGHTKWWARSCWNDACYTVLYNCWKSIAPKDTCDWKAMESAISWSCRSVSESLEEFQFPPIEDFLQQGHDIVSRRSWGMLETSYYPPTAAMISSESFARLLHTNLAASPKSTS